MPNVIINSYALKFFSSTLQHCYHSNPIAPDGSEIFFYITLFFKCMKILFSRLYLTRASDLPGALSEVNTAWRVPTQRIYLLHSALQLATDQEISIRVKVSGSFVNLYIFCDSTKGIGHRRSLTVYLNWVRFAYYLVPINK